MTTTIELDEAIVWRVMEISGMRTAREAVEFALAEAERNSRLSQLLSEPFFDNVSDPIIDPNYDLSKSRQLEKP